MEGQGVFYSGRPPPYPAFPPGPQSANRTQQGDDAVHASLLSISQPVNPLYHVQNPEWIDNGGSEEQSLVRYEPEDGHIYSVDAYVDRSRGVIMSQTPLPQTETHAHQQSIGNSTFQGANVLQQNNYFSGLTAVLSFHYINQNARVAINNGHNKTIYNATDQYGAASSYSLDQVQFQPHYQEPAIPDFVYGQHGFEQRVEFVAAHQVFGNRTLAANDSREATTQGVKNQRVEAPALLEPAQFKPSTNSSADALNHRKGPPLFTNLPRSTLALAPIIVGGLPRPGKLLPDTSAFASRANDSDSTYGDQLVGRPAHNVEPPRNFDISILEINTFFPRWFLLPEVAMRAQMNGWDRKEVAKAQLRAKNQLDNITAKTFNRAQNRIQKCFSEGGKLMFQIPIGKEAEEVKLLFKDKKLKLKWKKEILENSNFPKDNLTAVNWHLRSYYKSSTREEHFGHIPLSNVYSYIPLENWPKGDDRMILTKCLEFARANHGLDLDTSHFGWIVEQLNFTQGEFQTSDADKAALVRFKTAVPDPEIRNG